MVLALIVVVPLTKVPSTEMEYVICSPSSVILNRFRLDHAVPDTPTPGLDTLLSSDEIVMLLASVYGESAIEL